MSMTMSTSVYIERYICLYMNNIFLTGDQEIGGCPWGGELGCRVRRKVFTRCFLLCNVGTYEMYFSFKIK